MAEGPDIEVPFLIARVFNVQAKIGNIRGKYAHHHCTQLLICANGSIENSRQGMTFSLKGPSKFSR